MSDGLAPVVDAAIARFDLMRKMRAELAATRIVPEDRKQIDRAKGIVMRAR